MIFEGLSVGNNYHRPESAPLMFVILATAKGP